MSPRGETRATVARALLSGGALCAAASLTACAADFQPVSFVDRSRVVGVRVSVDGADTTEPDTGDEVTLAWGVIEQPGATRLSHIAIVCAGGASTGAMAAGGCSGTPIATSGFVSSPLAPLTFTMPATDVTLLIATCDRGASVALDPRASTPVTCSGGETGARSDLAYLLLRHAPTDRDANLAVTWHADSLRFGGAPWPEGDDCTASELPHVTVGERVDAMGDPTGEEVVIGIVWDEGERERYARYRCTPTTPPTAPEDEIESLEVSHYVTAGELERAYSFIEGTATPSPLELTWTSPPRAELAPGVTRVDVFFSLRDVDPNCGTRGGYDLVRRTICVSPR